MRKPEKSFWRLRKAGKAQKDNEKLRKPENQKKSHGKPEKACFYCGKPETDPLFPALNISDVYLMIRSQQLYYIYTRLNMFKYKSCYLVNNANKECVAVLMEL